MFPFSQELPIFVAVESVDLGEHLGSHLTGLCPVVLEEDDCVAERVIAISAYDDEAVMW